MSTLEIAVIGSGPAGLYTAEALIKQAAVLPEPPRLRVDVIDRLPTPYGLVRYGVAPDHKSIKSIADYLRGVLEHRDVRFLGGVHLGSDVTREELLGCYDAVVYATGAMRDRRLAIPGEDLPGSYAATDFVNWYCGHPDIDPDAFTLDAESVAVIGVGNVAVDVARILARDPADLHGTDVPQPVLGALIASKVREVHVIGRRGPAQAKFTTKELRELGELAGVEIDVRAEDMAADPADPAGQDRRVRGNLTVLREWAGRCPPQAGAGSQLGQGRRLAIRFWLRPAAIEGIERVTGVTVERTAIDAQGVVTGTGEYQTIGAQLVLRSVGYQSVPLPGVPFDERRATVPNESGRVLADGAVLPGEYVAGWLKRGPTGVIGTNKSDAAETVRSLLADLAGGPGPGDVALPRAGLLPYPDPQSGAAQSESAPSGSDGSAGQRPTVADTLARRGVRPVSYQDWLRIEAAEAELARSLGRGGRVKLAGRGALLAACRPPAG
jgi:ferredoxin--NADP+ reductase